jgi:hypothetical protein
MTVDCGWGGQPFQEHCCAKVATLRQACPMLDIQVRPAREDAWNQPQFKNLLMSLDWVLSGMIPASPFAMTYDDGYRATTVLNACIGGWRH